MSKLKKFAIIGGVVVAGGAVVALTATRVPGVVRVTDDAPRYAGAEIQQIEHGLTMYRAEYQRWTAVLGITVQRTDAVQSAERTADGSIDAVFEFPGQGHDFMRLRERDLVLSERSFGQEGGPGQRFQRVGNRIDAEVIDAEGATRELSFDYPVAVFEPSLLELPLALLDLAPGAAGYLAWSNFGDPEDHWLPFRAIETESIEAAGRTWETTRVRLAFPDGRQRDYWVATEPPYKIRMVAYENGSLLTTGWNLTELEIFD
ncbi:MAG: hypothetical protein GKS06_09725 [Acidobacteria bacterium]|nr:hypothetical protein [Acidobacteriota bacterium]